MSNFGLQQNTSVPLYRQLKDKILSDISSGKLAEGEKIPTEIELSELYNISRITVRNAVKELVAEGYLVKKSRGRGLLSVCLKLSVKLFTYLALLPHAMLTIYQPIA